MATMHYEHGKYHVHYEVYKAEKNNNQDNSSTGAKQVSENEHLIVDRQYDHLNYTITKVIFATQSSTILDGYLECNYIPPEL